MAKKTTIPILFIDAKWPSGLDSGASEISSTWARHALDDLQCYNRKHRVYSIRVLDGPTATRHNVDRELRKIQDEKGLIVFYGHGCKCGESLYETQYGVSNPYMAAIDPINVKLLRNKIVYTVACHSTKMLGQYSITNGTISYIGYDDALPVATDHSPIPGLIDAVNVGLKLLTETSSTTIRVRDAIYNRFDVEILRLLIIGSPDAVLNAWAMSNGQYALVSPNRMGNRYARLR